MTTIPKLQFAAAVHSKAGRAALFDALERTHGRRDLQYVGTAADGTHYFQEWGNPQPFTVQGTMTKPTPTSPENQARISAFFSSIETLMCNLADRWADEAGYEDIAEYQARLEKELPAGFAITGMRKRPFGFDFTIGTEAAYRITLSANGNYEWKRTK